jgi:hypothetical protein
MESIFTFLETIAKELRIYSDVFTTIIEQVPNVSLDIEWTRYTRTDGITRDYYEVRPNFYFLAMRRIR